jgi:hypothetical protein
VTAVVLIGFNRPEHTARSLDAIRQARPERIFMLADGPRDDRPEDQALCRQVREVMDTVDWPCEVQRRYSEVNLGCEGNVETGLDWVFGQTPDAVIIEDDCVADPTFFAYAAELLERYRAEPAVWQIAGGGHGVPAPYFGEDSYRFAAWASVWGWATWADRWQRHRAIFPRDHQGPDGDAPVRMRPAVPRTGLLVTKGGRAHFAEAASSDDIIRHGWDKQWWLTMMTEGGLAATPAVNMVQNVGFGAGATHGVFERETDPALPMPLPLHHPEAVALDVGVERELELLLSRLGGRTAALARRWVTHPALRTVGRKVLHSNTAARATRLASRLTDRGVSRD